MVKTYKILSLLLSYPGTELQQFLPEAEFALREENLLPEEQTEGIAEFCRYYASADLIDWQAEYVQLFDYSGSASLHLFEHVKGDSKDRGQAMVDLMEFYRENGMKLTTTELPDYLPVYLEFLSELPPAKAAELLGVTVNVVEKIRIALSEKGNIYSRILQAIISLSDGKPDKKIIREMIKNEMPKNQQSWTII